ncbi:hypothetical protein CDAR_369721 [Caerostris darwini]|uniref:Uncharacterized protein n=1 Tax=Caerostris darwini TaxID=1538125 RepID=A0AAV4RUL9_9ARAC|nr:hypothetical protein CDAR_369721 [Caerostris darwini]
MEKPMKSFPNPPHGQAPCWGYRLPLSPLEVLTVTTRTRLSSPGCTSEIRPKGHVAGGRLDSFMRMKSPTWRFSSGFLYLVLCCRECKHSLSHLFQNPFRIL